MDKEALEPHRQILYKKNEADSLQEREASWEGDARIKVSLLLQNLGTCERLVDIGCGWGQFLRFAQDCVPEVWGVDESPHRVKDIKQLCPMANVLISRADHLGLGDGCFDVVVTSQILHEVKLFGRRGDLQLVLREIRRILADNGRYLLLDHQDAGEGEVLVKLPTEKMGQLVEYESKFQYYLATHQNVGEGLIEISKRCLQDFLTKDWSLCSPMESIEMNETHNVFEKNETTELLESTRFVVEQWISFSDIRDDLKRINGELIEGESWFRKFLLIALK